MNTLLACLFAVVVPNSPSADDILAAVSHRSATRHEIAYSGVRHYTLRNARFGKYATVKVHMSSLPGEGKLFTIVERSGATRLTSILEKLLASEAEASRPGKTDDHEIGPANYAARIRGSETVAGRDCYVLELTPKSKSKYLVNGTLWVDKQTYGIVRLTGTTAASVSMWVGTPQIDENFAYVEGLWLPQHLVSTSNSMLLGESGLEIHFGDYQFPGPLTGRTKAPVSVKDRM